MAWQNLSKPDFRVSVAGGECSEETVRKLGETCHKLTSISPPNCHKLTDLPNADLSRINPLYSEVLCDEEEPDQLPTRGAVVCPITGVAIGDTSRQGRGVRRFVSAAILHNDDDLLMQLNARFGQYAKGSKEDEISRAAHNVRNAHSNPRNNLRRRIARITQHPTLFNVADVIRLTPDQRAALDHWQGTPYEIKL